MADSPSPFELAIMPTHVKPHRDEKAELRHRQAELQMKAGINPTRAQRTAVLLTVWCHCATAATINVTTNDNYTEIEAAKAGDQVLIAPGTYGRDLSCER
jgi:hypothetical protein